MSFSYYYYPLNIQAPIRTSPVSFYILKEIIVTPTLNMVQFIQHIDTNVCDDIIISLQEWFGKKFTGKEIRQALLYPTLKMSDKHSPCMNIRLHFDNETLVLCFTVL